MCLIHRILKLSWSLQIILIVLLSAKKYQNIKVAIPQFAKNKLISSCHPIFIFKIISSKIKLLCWIRLYNQLFIFHTFQNNMQTVAVFKDWNKRWQAYYWERSPVYFWKVTRNYNFYFQIINVKGSNCLEWCNLILNKYF